MSLTTREQLQIIMTPTRAGVNTQAQSSKPMNSLESLDNYYHIVEIALILPVMIIFKYLFDELLLGCNKMLHIRARFCQPVPHAPLQFSYAPQADHPPSTSI